MTWQGVLTDSEVPESLLPVGESTAEPDPLWPEGRLRLFMSHTWRNKADVAAVKNELFGCGIAGFMAHQDIKPSDEWQDVIKSALGTCDALAAFLTDAFHGSEWTDQEIGYCLGRGVPIVPVMLGNIPPYGFIGRIQGAHCQSLPASSIAKIIFATLFKRPELRPEMENALINAFVLSGSFEDANQRSLQKVDHVSNWTPDRLRLIRDALTRNSQIIGSWYAKPRVDRILSENVHIWQPIDDEVPF